jgi:hypothetical protein
MADLSENERKVLRAVLTNEMHESPLGPERVGASIWCESLNAAAEPTGIKDGKILSAIISALVTKKLVKSDGETVELTKEGYEAASAQG